MRFAIVGGDLRAARLGALLLRDGHRVHSYALERAPLPAELPRDDSLTACVYGADCVVLPCPTARSGVLIAPLSELLLPMGELLPALWPGQLVLGGGFDDACGRAAVRQRLKLVDLLRREDYLAGNAAITAEGAVGLLLRESGRTLRGARVLICGWGRIGRLLALRLAALGARVAAAARSPRDRAMIAALGLRALDYGELEAAVGEFDLLVNTVPARVLGEGALCCVSQEALLLELASPPGGFDRQLAENIGLRVLTAPGLPGKSVPLSAAELLRDVIERCIREQEE